MRLLAFGAIICFLFQSAHLIAVERNSSIRCFSETWSFSIDKNTDDILIGSLILRNNLLQQIQLKKDSLKDPKYSKLKALYKGNTSQDSYELFIFKEKEKSGHVSFLTSQSNLGHEKVIELRCNF